MKHQSSFNEIDNIQCFKSKQSFANILRKNLKNIVEDSKAICESILAQYGLYEPSIILVY